MYFNWLAICDKAGTVFKASFSKVYTYEISNRDRSIIIKYHSKKPTGNSQDYVFQFSDIKHYLHFSSSAIDLMPQPWLIRGFLMMFQSEVDKYRRKDTA